MSSNRHRHRDCSDQVAFAQTRLDLTWCELDHDEAEATMRIADVLRNKGATVATITPETSVVWPAQRAGRAQHRRHGGGVAPTASSASSRSAMSCANCTNTARTCWTAGVGDHDDDGCDVCTRATRSTTSTSDDDQAGSSHPGARERPAGRASSASATSSRRGWTSWRPSRGSCRPTSPVAEIGRAAASSGPTFVRCPQCWPARSTTTR